MGVKLWVDDHENRDPEKVRPGENWVWVRTITEAIRILDEQDVEEVSLDHDISMKVRVGRGEPRPFASEETFEPVARFLHRLILVEIPWGTHPKVVYLHSASPVGRLKMRTILETVGEIIKLVDRPLKPCNKYEGDDE